jgi:enoyl-CoA hydratase/carnithine racemase
MLRRERHEEIVVLRLDKPEKLNAWDRELRTFVRTTLAELDGDAGVKAVAFTGTGSRAFCAGADLSDTTIGEPSAAEDRMTAFRDLYRGIQSFRKPLVAALNGLALGSAFQAALLMDYRVAHRGVQVGMPELNSGIPCFTGSSILAASVGIAQARKLALSGDFIDAEEALQHGLIDEVVDAERVLGRAIEVATALSKKSPVAFAETKLWFRDMMQPALDAAFERAAAVRSRTETSHGIQSGVAGFLGRTHANK